MGTLGEPLHGFGSCHGDRCSVASIHTMRIGLMAKKIAGHSYQLGIEVVYTFQKVPNETENLRVNNA